MNQENPSIDMKEAIELLGTSQPTFYRWLREGRIPGRKVGRQWRFDRQDIEAIARGEQPSAPAAPDTAGLNETLAKQLAKLKQRADFGQEAPVFEAMMRILLLATASGANRVHLEAGARGGSARMRVDGVLRKIADYSAELHKQLVATVKGQCHCAVDVTDLPQDGRWKTAEIGADEVDLRITTLPSVFGEDVVIRFSDQWSIPALDELGLVERQLTLIREALAETHGANLATGPTGSGKTTLLYAMLAECVGLEAKTIAVGENIVPSLAHTQYVPVRKHRMPVAHVLRAVSRMDADNVLVEEIDSEEAARELFACSDLGRRVFTQLHAPTPVEALVRLRELGIPPHQILDNVRLVTGQRLLRKTCPDCAEAIKPDPATIDALVQRAGLPVELLAKAKWKTARGCETCNGVGYRGRLAAVEALPLRGRLREAFAADADTATLQAAAREEGYLSLMGEALLVAAAGHTTLEEVARVFRA